MYRACSTKISERSYGCLDKKKYICSVHFPFCNREGLSIRAAIGGDGKHFSSRII